MKPNPEVEGSPACACSLQWRGGDDRPGSDVDITIAVEPGRSLFLIRMDDTCLPLSEAATQPYARRPASAPESGPSPQ
ncbi:MAG: hypothetical protein EA405_06945 [Rhodospirillales bacterium]|nr:MAG: hypothetical protein EA405_06945 [Rhodospirillales bacterium]